MNEFKDIISEDYRLMGGKRNGNKNYNIVLFYLHRLSFRIVINYRIGNWFRRRGYRLGGVFFDRLNWKLGADIDSNASIGKGLRIPHPKGIVISGSAIIGNYCQVQQNVTIGGNFGKHKLEDEGWSTPRIGNKVFIGPGAVVIGPITIEDNVTIGANSVVTKDVHKNSMVFGYNNIRLSVKAK